MVSRKEADSIKLKKCKDVVAFRDWLNQSRNDICGKSGRNDDCYSWFKELERPACSKARFTDESAEFSGTHKASEPFAIPSAPSFNHFERKPFSSRRIG